MSDDNKREAYEIELDPINFEPDSDSKFMLSQDFERLVNSIFKSVFADWYGATFEVINGMPVFNFHFRHIDPVEGEHMATERTSSKTLGNSILDKTRSRDYRLKEGDRYYITEDGMDVIKKLLIPRAYAQGKPNWKNLVSEVQDRIGNMYQPQIIPLTKVTMIDPARIASMIWGYKDDNSEVEYGINVLRDTNANMGMGVPGSINPNYLLIITRAHVGALSKTSQSLGIGSIGSRILH